MSSSAVCGTPLTYAWVTTSTPATSSSGPSATLNTRPSASHDTWNRPRVVTSPVCGSSRVGAMTSLVVSIADAAVLRPMVAPMPQKGSENNAKNGCGVRIAPQVHTAVNDVHTAANPSSVIAAGERTPFGGTTTSSAPPGPFLAAMREPEGARTGVNDL